MLKGVNRQVVEILQPESAYFEKVIFFVKPEFSHTGEMKLKSSADALIKKAAPPPCERDKDRKYIIRQRAKLIIAAGMGAVASAIGFTVLF